MSAVATAIAGAAVIGAVGSNMAANTQAAGQQQAAATQQGMFSTINQQEQPFIQGGYSALNELLYGLGAGGSPTSGATAAPQQTPGPAVRPGSTPMRVGGGGQYVVAGNGAVQSRMQTGPTATPTTTAAGGAVSPGASPNAGGITAGQFTHQFNAADLNSNLSPGYAFQLAQGGAATRNADTPGVGALSGAALKDLMSFNQGLASTSYQQAYNNWNNTNNTIFARLSGIAGLGQNAATNVGTAGTSLGTGIAQAQAGAAASQAGGIVGATNSIAGAGVPLAYLMGNSGGGGGSFGAGGNNTGLYSGNPVAGVNVGGD